MEDSSKLFTPELLDKYQKENPSIRLSDIVYACLEQAILTSQIQPGSKINAANIAGAMNISITPVRVAIRRLISSGLIQENESGKSYCVFNISERMISDIFDCRWVLEGSAAYICAQKVALINMKELRKLAEEFRISWEQFSNGDQSIINRQRRAELDCLFHQKIIAYTENPYIQNCYEEINKIIAHSLLRTQEFWSADNSLNIRKLAYQHHIICNGIESGIPDVARQVAEQQVNYAKLRGIINRKT